MGELYHNSILDNQYRIAYAAATDQPRAPAIVRPRPQSEQRTALRASEPNPSELLRAIVDNTPVATMAFDREHRLTFWNPAAERLLGWSPHEVLGKPFPGGAIPGEDRSPVPEGVERALAGEIVNGDRVRRRTRDGREVTLEIYGARLRDAAGFQVGYAGQMIDVTERDRAQQEQRRLMVAMDQTVDGIVITGADGRIQYANAAYGQQTGYTSEELIGQSGTEIAVGLVGKPVIAEIEASMADGRPWLGEVEQHRRDGSSHQVQISVTPFHDATGTVTSFVAVSRDVTELREMEAELALEARVRFVLARALHGLEPDATFEESAQSICDELATLPWVDFAAVGTFITGNGAVLLASSAPAGFPMRPGDILPAHRAQRLLDNSAHGPWAEYWQLAPADGAWGQQLDAVGLKAFAYGPIVHGDHVDGGVVIGTRDPAVARTLVEKMAAVVDFSTTPSALLAERLHVRRRQLELRESVAATIATRAFRPVFQPILDLVSGETVAYEALTRFDSQVAADRAFADARSVGLGLDLETATLEAAIDAARQLSAGSCLAVNLSPRLVVDRERLGAVLAAADRPVVLEITEHEAVADYAALRDAVLTLRPDVRLAVDDAGAGVANFGHILELGADFVKLDISLTRGINADLGRQALVVGMSHFAKAAGCRLVAEGIETEEEANTLRELGVEYGQGYLFGRPEPA